MTQRSARHLHPLRQARPLPGRHPRARRRPPARRRSRLGLRRPRHLLEVPGRPRPTASSPSTASPSPRTRSRPGTPSRNATTASAACAPGRRLGCQAQILGDAVIDVPPESQVHKQVVRKRAEARQIVMDPATRLYYVEVAEPDMHEPSGDLQRLERALAEQWGLDERQGRPAHPADAAAGAAQGRLEGHLRRLPRRRRRRASCTSGPASTTARSTASPSTSARPPSPATSATSPPARSSPRPA